MFPKSIRWRLQLWYGLILVAVLAGFGITACQLERSRRMRMVDAELQERMSMLSRSLEFNKPRNGGPEGRFRDRPPPPDDLDGLEDPGPPREGFRRGFPPPRRKFKLPPQFEAFFGGNSPAAYYYYIRSRDGTLLSMSSNAPTERILRSDALLQNRPADNLPVPETVDPNVKIIIRPSAAVNGAPDQFKTMGMSNATPSSAWSAPSGQLREISMSTPPGEFMVVGRSIEPDLAELRHFGWSLAGIGGVVLLCGLAGGWALASRAIRPIEDIGATAVKIAAGDLSQRIDAADTDNELGRLAGVLNSTFARLEASFAQQARFTADAAHELRTPVTVLLTQTQTALKRERDSAEYRATIEACQRAAQRMRGLLESLLELARLDAGQDSMKKMRFDLGNTVRECVELIRPLTAERNIKIEADTPALEWVGDMERLTQVITNLLTNAIHYNKDGGEMSVAVCRQKHEALITVADHGIGISAEDLPRIFERFYRADKSRSNARGRTGLGLAISKAIVEAHGGRIEVASEPGKGTVFTVRLPERE